MGLLYVMPISLKEKDRIELNQSDDSTSITLKSYGLPFMFWGYYSICLIVVGTMTISVSRPILSIIKSNDVINKIIAIAALISLLSVPLIGAFLLFLEKRITKIKNKLILSNHILGIKIKSKEITLKSTSHNLYVEHLLESPNVAKIRSDNSTKAFENRGHYLLKCITENGEIIIVDRHTRKSDLLKMAELLKNY